MTAMDAANWRFWRDENGRDTSLIHIGGSSLSIVTHPQASPSLENEIRQWAHTQLRQRAQQASRTHYKAAEDVSVDGVERVAQLEAAGFQRDTSLYTITMRRDLSLPISSLQLPDGFILRHIAGEAEAAMRGTLHRASFLPYFSESDEVATANHKRIMQTPAYDHTLDLMIVAANGRPATACICWLDETNKVGLFEPVGTHPHFRRLGLATQLMLGGLHILKERGMKTAELGAMHPGENCAISAEFTSSRHVFHKVGFHTIHKLFYYGKEFSV